MGLFTSTQLKRSGCYLLLKITLYGMVADNHTSRGSRGSIARLSPLADSESMMRLCRKTNRNASYLTLLIATI